MYARQSEAARAEPARQFGAAAPPAGALVRRALGLNESTCDRLPAKASVSKPEEAVRGMSLRRTV
ncbi:MAG: hypothetical protein OXD30_10560 [Bryobacterales bacterium]|nr:hypothetical protein [Bryobacterales bacterium]